MRVGLIGSPERKELQRLAIRLEERGAEAIALDPRGDPRIQLAPGLEQACGIDLSRLSACYVADLALPGVRARDDGDAAAADFALRASQRRLVLWNTVLERLARRVRVVNPPATWDLHGLKPFEMRACARLGLAVPRTLATSAPAALLELPRDVPAWVTKGMVGGYGYTETFQPPTTLEEARALLASQPRMVQQRIEGDNVRVFVVGERALGAAEIVSSEAGEVDSRRGAARVRRTALPDQARAAALAATRRFGLAFSAVDFMRAAGDGRWWLLECNSAPFFVEFERHSGIDVSSPLADLLTSRARRPAATAP